MGWLHFGRFFSQTNLVTLFAGDDEPHVDPSAEQHGAQVPILATENSAKIFLFNL
jgi:hypothetical protein